MYRISLTHEQMKRVEIEIVEHAHRCDILVVEERA